MHDERRFDEQTRRWLQDLAGAGSVVLVRDEHRRLVHFSDNVQTATGWNGEDFVERLYSLVHPDDQSLLFGASRDLRERGVKRCEFPLRVLRPDGGFRWFHCHLENRFEDPQVRGLVSRLDPLGSAVPAIERHSQLLATTNEIVLVLDRDQRPTYVSPSVEHVLGLTPDELVRRWDTVVADADLEAFDEVCRETLARRGSETQLRLRVRRADGETRVLDTVVANRFDDEAVRGLLVSARDVTTLVETEQRLGRTEAYFESMVSASPDVFALLDADGTLRYVSPGVTTMLGFDVEEMVGRGPLDFVHPEDLDFAAIELAQLAGTPNQTTHVVIRLRRKDGRAVWVDVSSRNELHRPDLRAMVTTLRDVTERIDEQQRMERLLQDSSSVAFVVDQDLRVIWKTPGVERFIGDADRLRPEAVRALFEPEEGVDPVAVFEEVVESGPGASRSLLGRLETATGDQWIELTLSNGADDPAIAGVFITIRDVDDAVRASEAGQRLDQVLGSTTDLAFIADADSTIIWANPSAADVFGEPPVSAVTVLRCIPEWVVAALDRDVRPALVESGSWTGELAVLTPDGEEVPIEATMRVHRGRHGEVSFMSVFARDISDRKVLEERLHVRARTDPLTGLPNRSMLTEHLTKVLEADRSVAVALLDLDQFKAVNETQGHDAGDQLLVAIADRLRSSVPETDFLARFGGDEFVIVLGDVADMDDARTRVEQVLSAIRGLVRVGKIDVFTTASAGVALSNGRAAAPLLSCADTAMYAAKSRGRDQVTAYSDDLRTRSLLRLETAHDLRAALKGDGGLELWYQPIVTTDDRRAVGMEGLIRWRHPELGLLSPAQFIPIAEETGLISALGRLVIREACASLGALCDGIDPCTVSVNISAHQLGDPDLSAVLGECLESYSVPSGALTCEITESALMQDVTQSARVLDEIRALGVGIAVDDFGTGYSSLAYLHRFPVDVLKIDREFIRGLSNDEDWQHSLAAGIISLGHSLDLVVVAEGVETDEQAQILARLGCDAMQGFLFGRPTPQPEIHDVLHGLGA